jgi:hypothetical protein
LIVEGANERLKKKTDRRRKGSTRQEHDPPGSRERTSEEWRRQWRIACATT